MRKAGISFKKPQIVKALLYFKPKTLDMEIGGFNSPIPKYNSIVSKLLS